MSIEVPGSTVPAAHPASTRDVATEPSTALAAGRISAGQALFFGLTAVGIASVLSGIGATLVFSSGDGSWIAMVAGSLIALLLGTVVVRFSKRHLTTGSIMSYLTLEMGPRVGVLGGAALFVGYIGVFILFLSLSLVFLVSFLGGIGVDVTSTWLQVLIGVALIAGCVILGRRGVSVSVNTAVVLGWVSVPFVLVILVMAVVRSGETFAPEFGLSGFSLGGFVPGFVLAYGAFAGFEGFTALAQETTEPRRTVPRLVMSLVAIVAVVAVVSTFLTVPIFGAHSKEILAGDSPLHVLASVAQLGGLGTIVDLLLFLASVGSLLAYINDAGRIMGTAARDGLLPRALGVVHPRFKTPSRAIVFVGAAGTIVFVSYLLLTQVPIYTAFIDFALVASYAWSIAYIALSVVGVVDGVRTRSPLFAAGAAVAAVAVAFALVATLASTAGAVSYVTLGAILLLFVAGLIVRRRSSIDGALESL